MYNERRTADRQTDGQTTQRAQRVYLAALARRDAVVDTSRRVAAHLTVAERKRNSAVRHHCIHIHTPLLNVASIYASPYILLGVVPRNCFEVKPPKLKFSPINWAVKCK